MNMRLWKEKWARYAGSDSLVSERCEGGSCGNDGRVLEILPLSLD